MRSLGNQMKHVLRRLMRAPGFTIITLITLAIGIGANTAIFSVIEGSPGTAVLTYGYWQRRFGGAASVVGRRIVVDARAREIIGVAPRSFRFMNPQPELVLPMQFNRAKTNLGNFSYRAVARLRP